MGWLGGKSTHKKEVDAAYKVLANLFEVTTNGGADAPLVLRFSLPHSRFRYLVFCLSTVQMACARYMKNPDAVLNELLHTVINGAIALEPQMFFGDAVVPQRAANDGGGYIQEYLHRWSAYVDIRGGGNRAAGTAIVCAMLASTESLGPPAEGDARRLMPLASWIEEQLTVMGGAFVTR